MTEEMQVTLGAEVPTPEVETPIIEPETSQEEVSVEPRVEESVVEEAKEPDVIAPVVEEPLPEPVVETPIPEPAEQVAAFTPQAPVPKDGQAPVQRQTAFTSQTIVRGSEEAAKQNQQPGIGSHEPAPTPADRLETFYQPGVLANSATQSAIPITDLKSAILQSLNPKSFFPISHILRRYFGARFATQEAAKEARVLLEQLHNSRQIVVNNNRHMQLSRPFYTSASPMTQYHTLDKTPLEAMLGVGVAK